MVNVLLRSVQQEATGIFIMVNANSVKRHVVHARVNMISVHRALQRKHLFQTEIVLSASSVLMKNRGINVGAKLGNILTKYIISVSSVNFLIALNVMMNFAIVARRTTN